MKCSYYIKPKHSGRGDLKIDDLLPGFSENPIGSTLMLTDTLRLQRINKKKKLRRKFNEYLYDLYYDENGNIKPEYQDKSIAMMPMPLIDVKGWRCPDCGMKSFDSDSFFKQTECEHCGRKIRWPEEDKDDTNSNTCNDSDSSN